jgi:7-dehydrocholesterol reductase
MINVLRDFFNYVLSPLFLMTVTPVFVLSLWDMDNMLGYMPGNEYSWNITFIFILFQYFMLMLSDVEVKGPRTTKNDMGYYKGNGLETYIFTMGMYVYLCVMDYVDPIRIFDNLGYFFSTFIILGYIVTTCLYVKALIFPNSIDCQKTGYLLFDYYWGIELHPRFMGIDIKQLTNCRFGMMIWPMLLLTYMFKQYSVIGYVSNSLLCNCLLQLVYITKFFYWEDGYFKTIDIMVDKGGFYICWGCIAFLPLFYTSHSLYLVYHPKDLDMYSLLTIYIIGLTSIFLNYYVDYERKVFRESEGNIITFGKKATYIKAKYIDNYKLERYSMLLTSGFWGISRHINYFFEILSAFMWSVPAQFDSLYPYYYVIFLTILLVHREMRDDERCSEKYHEYWEMYKKKVPYRILKYIY